MLAGSQGKLLIGATILDASADRPFGLADAVLDAVLCSANCSAVVVPVRRNTCSMLGNRLCDL